MKNTNHSRNVTLSSRGNLSNEINDENDSKTRRSPKVPLFHKLLHSTLRHNTGSLVRRINARKYKSKNKSRNSKDEKVSPSSNVSSSEESVSLSEYSIFSDGIELVDDDDDELVQLLSNEQGSLENDHINSSIESFLHSMEYRVDIPSEDFISANNDQTTSLETSRDYGTIHKTTSHNDKKEVFELCSPSSNKSNQQRTKRLGLLRNDSIEIDFLSDPKSSMTYGRKIALFLMRLSWYVKSGKNYASALDSNSCISYDSKKLRLAKAWAYFEHVTLPRYVVCNKNGDKKGETQKADALLRAKPGEKNFLTSLYSPISTPLSQMGDFGIAIGLYFSMLHSMTIIMFLAGIIITPNIWFYQSNKYTPDGHESIHSWILKSSSICTNLTWVVCQGCNETNFELDPGRFAATRDKGLTFVLKNDCKGAQLAQGITHYVAMMVVVLGIIIVNYLQRKREVEFDEDEQTAQDYSLVVKNPPIDVYDPDEWKSFFSQFGHVSCCTVALRNEMLLRLLADRRSTLQELVDMLPPGSELNEHTMAEQTTSNKTSRVMFFWQMMLQPFGLLLDISTLYDKYLSQNIRIRMLSQKKHGVSAVFITFETEKAQRSALTTLSVGRMYVWRNYLGALSSPNHLFQGELVLDVEEADEPSSIRWEYLSVTFATRLKRILVTTIASIVAITIIVAIVTTCHDYSVIYSSFAIAGFNTAFPMFAGAMISWEAHSSEGSKEASLYTKIAVFRLVNTAIIMSIITPFTSSLSLESNGLIPGIYAIFFADITTTNLLQIADPVGHIQRHYLAPREANQNLIIKQFEGTSYNLAERYTNATKIIFTVFYYSAIFPPVFFLGAFSLLINYYADRFSIMRTWSPAPKMGKQISEFNRKYFLSTAIVALVVVSSFNWSGFPYDNICQDSSLVESIYVGNHTIYNFTDTHDGRFITNLEQRIEPTKVPVAITESDHSFHFCSQNFWTQLGMFWALLSKEQKKYDWMTNEQENMTKIYGWTSIVIVIGVLSTFLYHFGTTVVTLFLSPYKSVGEDQCQNFSDLVVIEGYIPQVESPAYIYPLLACDISSIDENLLSWTDPDHSFDIYRLDHDMRTILGKEESSDINFCHLFSSVRHWPSPEV